MLFIQPVLIGNWRRLYTQAASKQIVINYELTYSSKQKQVNKYRLYILEKPPMRVRRVTKTVGILLNYTNSIYSSLYQSMGSW